MIKHKAIHDDDSSFMKHLGLVRSTTEEYESLSRMEVFQREVDTL
jgi:hypothetical protein